jgi:beta-glucanase (GH16 family)
MMLTARIGIFATALCVTVMASACGQDDADVQGPTGGGGTSGADASEAAAGGTGGSGVGAAAGAGGGTGGASGSDAGVDASAGAGGVAGGAAGGAAGRAGGSSMNLDPNVWELEIDDDFSGGFDTNRYRVFCGAQGGDVLNNFHPDDVYVEGGVLVMRARYESNECGGSTREFSGGGWATNYAATEIAAEFEIKGNSVKGTVAYATTWPAPDEEVEKGWGAEDDFFEQKGADPGAPFQTYHAWDENSEHVSLGETLDVPDAATEYHAYGVVREIGNVTFYLDGQPTHSENAYFEPYRMNVGAGFGSFPAGWADGPPDTASYPTYWTIRRVRVWRKK